MTTRLQRKQRVLVVTPGELRAINSALALHEAELENGPVEMGSTRSRNEWLAECRTNLSARTKVHEQMLPEDYR